MGFAEISPQSRILLGVCFDEYDLLREVIRQKLPIRRSPDALRVRPLADDPSTSEQLSDEAEIDLEKSIIDELQKSTERDLGAESAIAIVSEVKAASEPPPLPPRSNAPPPPLPQRSQIPAIPVAAPRWRPSIDWEKISDRWFKEHARDTDPNNITMRFDDIFDEFRSKRDHSTIIKQLIGSEVSELIYLFVPGLYAGRMPFKVRQDMNVVWGRRMGELQAMGLDARVIQVPIDGPVLLNATIIGSLIQDLHAQFPEKKFVLVGYSKGGVDFSAALAVLPEIRPLVRCFVTMFSPLFGSHIATDLNGSGLSTITSVRLSVPLCHF